MDTIVRLSFLYDFYLLQTTCAKRYTQIFKYFFCIIEYYIFEIIWLLFPEDKITHLQRHDATQFCQRLYRNFPAS